ncbi:oligosaccharide flippase family protein [Sporolactobacillus sp. Y61]|uniref:Oligosaccharide flippase family protein n=1 Tax=Sporolactobacillus sp. Y61 TaxID=3160863 RepID=A0AAU8IIE4_9BACL
MEIGKIFKNASYLFIGNMGIRLISALTTILLARFIGPEAFGIFAVAMSISGIATYFADLGLTETFIREANKINSNMSILLGSYFLVRTVLAVGSIMVTLIFVQLVYHGSSIPFIISCMVIPMVTGYTLQGTANAFFQSTERMGVTASLNVMQGVLATSAMLTGIFLKWDLTLLSPVYGGSYLISGMIAFLIMLKCTSIKKGWNRGLLDQLPAFTVNGFILSFLPQIGPIVLERVMSLRIVGFFSSAFKIPSVLYQVPAVIATAFYPRLFLYGNNRDEMNHRKLSGIELKMMSFVGMAISMPFIIDPAFWIITLLGDEWREASLALAITSYMVVLQSINYPLADYLTTKGHQYKRMMVMACGLAVAIFAYILLGKYYGLTGASLAPVCVELTLLFGFCLQIKNSLLFLFHCIKYNVLAFIICRLLVAFIPDHYLFFAMFLITGLYVAIVFCFDKGLRHQLIILIQSKILKKEI